MLCPRLAVKVLGTSLALALTAVSPGAIIDQAAAPPADSVQPDQQPQRRERRARQSAPPPAMQEGQPQPQAVPQPPVPPVASPDAMGGQRRPFARRFQQGGGQPRPPQAQSQQGRGRPGNIAPRGGTHGRGGKLHRAAIAKRPMLKRVIMRHRMMHRLFRERLFDMRLDRPAAGQRGMMRGGIDRPQGQRRFAQPQGPGRGRGSMDRQPPRQRPIDQRFGPGAGPRRGPGAGRQQAAQPDATPMQQPMLQRRRGPAPI